ncbi:MAG: hypothetical protein IPN68_13425 [Bacteroidetes bacterium]|nr:hypothetical protein [Bacteroidota bacterium]
MGKDNLNFKQSGPYGPGVVNSHLVQGESYYAKPVEAESGNTPAGPLPEPDKAEVSMRVNNNPEQDQLTLRQGERNYRGKDYFLIVTMNNILIFSKDISTG